MTRIRSFAVFASLFLAGPALADSPVSSGDEPIVSRATEAEPATTATPARDSERRLSSWQRWRGKPYLRSGAPGVPPNQIDLRSEALDKALPIQTPYNGGSVF